MVDPEKSSLAPRVGAFIGASLAAIVSAGLVYWLGTGRDMTLSTPAPPPMVKAYAPAKPDAGQVVRAYEQVQQVYADQGRSGVAKFARSCAAKVSSDPASLDFCVAFDIYAASLIGDGEQARAWRADANVRDMSLARAALPPAQDPAERLGWIRELARQTSLKAPEPVTRLAQTAPRSAPQAKPAPHRSAAVSAKTTRKKPAAVKTASSRTGSAKPGSTKVSRAQAELNACRRRALAAPRTVCASPALRQADQRLQLAYRKALTAGVDPQRLAREQANFREEVTTAAPDRVAVEKLYYKRTRAVETLAESW